MTQEHEPQLEAWLSSLDFIAYVTRYGRRRATVGLQEWDEPMLRPTRSSFNPSDTSYRPRVRSAVAGRSGRVFLRMIVFLAPMAKDYGYSLETGSANYQ